MTRRKALAALAAVLAGILPDDGAIKPGPEYIIVRRYSIDEVALAQACNVPVECVARGGRSWRSA